LARSFNAEGPASPAREKLETILARLQNELFDLGSELATPPEAEYEGMFKVGAEDVRALELLMDECQAKLEPLKSFILPGGGPVSAFLHQARTVCRRAERDILRLSREEPLGAVLRQPAERSALRLVALGRQTRRAQYCGSAVCAIRRARRRRRRLP
jgi:cob(I)alamin adenosyltransferase